MTFNKRGFELFRADVNEALKKVGEKHSANLSCSNIKYSDVDFTMTLKAVKNDGEVDGNNTCEIWH